MEKTQSEFSIYNREVMDELRVKLLAAFQVGNIDGAARVLADTALEDAVTSSDYWLAEQKNIRASMIKEGYQLGPAEDLSPERCLGLAFTRTLEKLVDYYDYSRPSFAWHAPLAELAQEFKEEAALYAKRGRDSVITPANYAAMAQVVDTARNMLKNAIA